MENLKDVLAKYQPVKQTSGTRPINTNWEKAQEFGKYVGIPTLVVLRLFRLYSPEKVLALRSWLYDIPSNPQKGGKIALAHWKLKNTYGKKV